MFTKNSLPHSFYKVVAPNGAREDAVYSQARFDAFVMLTILSPQSSANFQRTQHKMLPRSAVNDQRHDCFDYALVKNLSLILHFDAVVLSCQEWRFDDTMIRRNKSSERLRRPAQFAKFFLNRHATR